MVTVGGGVKNKQLYETLTSKGYPFPGGTCPTVGVSGFTLGGGWGLSSRKFGLGCDSLIEIEMVNYKGQLIKANKFCNSDLFWAIRGSGGGNYGVVVSLSFALQKQKVDKVCLFSLYYPKATWEMQYDFLDVWQKWIVKGSVEINMRGGIYNDVEVGKYVYAIGLSYMNTEKTEEDLKEFLEIPGVVLSISYIPLKNAIELIEDTYPPYEYFKSAGRFVYKHLDYFDINKLLEIVNEERPKGSGLTAVNVYGLGGKVSQVDKNNTAFYYRNAKYILYIQTVFQDISYVQPNINWVNKNYPYLASITCGSYVNFPYEPLLCAEKEYYGDNSSRINEVKKKYDPLNIFTFPQGVGKNLIS